MTTPLRHMLNYMLRNNYSAQNLSAWPIATINQARLEGLITPVHGLWHMITDAGAAAANSEDDNR